MEANEIKPKIAIIYHSGDPDGFMSGYLIKQQYPDAVMFGYNYQEHADWMDMDFDEYIFGDVTPPINWLYKPSEHQIVRIFDHHEDAWKNIMAQAKDFVCRLIFNYDEKLSGAQIIFDSYNFGLDIGLSKLVMSIGKYDTWQHTLLPKNRQTEVLAINEFLRTLSFDQFCDILASDQSTLASFSHWLDIGNILIDKTRADNKKIAKNGIFVDKDTFFFAGYPNYWSFEDIAKHTGTEPKTLIAFRFDLENKKVEFAVRSKGLGGNARDIAKQFNGNGHPNAAGFRVKLSLGLYLIEHPEDIIIRRF